MEPIFLLPPINQDTGNPLTPTDIRLSQILPHPETTQLKCKKCKGVTEHQYTSLVIASAAGLISRKVVYVCINDGTTTVSTVKD